MRVKEQFNKYAHHYQKRSIIQQKGAELLVDALPKTLGTVIDLGCGSGRLLQLIEKKGIHFNKFYGVDFADSMLTLHPKGENIKLMRGDFNQKHTFEYLAKLNAQTLLSASALQWAKDIEFTFKNCAKSAPFGAFFLFSAGTFQTMHQIAKVTSPIHSYTALKEAFLKSYRPLQLKQYNFQLRFDSTLAMLRYIQKSGVSGNLQLSYSALKRVLKHYPYNYLEFETALFLGERL